MSGRSFSRTVAETEGERGFWLTPRTPHHCRSSSMACGGLKPISVKQVFGAFTGSALGVWLDSLGCDDVLILGFYAHMCVSTTAREALMRGLRVAIDPSGVGSCAIQHPTLGQLSADEARRTALLHLSHLGVRITPRTGGR